MENSFVPSNGNPPQSGIELCPARASSTRRSLCRGNPRSEALPQRRAVPASIALLVLEVSLLVWGTGCSTPPRNPNDLCAIFGEKHSWYRATRRSRERWEISQATQMAIIFQESSYRARARPPRTRLLWVIPWRRPSSAYGYAQVIRPTWESYLEATDNPGANRNNFWDASDFVGWYLDRISRRAEIRREDVRSLYLAYHEGAGGFQRGTHLKKDWLLKVSRRVDKRAARYRAQLGLCRERLEKYRWWWPF
jgi:hypothetical protein